MSVDNIRRLLAELHTELHSELGDSELDSETRAMMTRLDTDVQGLLEQEQEDGDPSQIAEQAGLLEARFAAEHPMAEKVMREIINTLARIGI
jgi:hypothetical protein